MEWQMKPSTWDLDLLQQAGNDNLAMRSSSLQIHNGQWSFQDGDHGSAAVYSAGLMGTNHNRNHDSNHMIGASQKVRQFPRPSSSGTTTTNTSRDSGSSSGLPAGYAADCSNGNRQAAALSAKDPAKLPAKLPNGWLYRGSGELPKVASGLNTGNGGTNHTNNGSNQSNYSNQQQQGQNSSSDRSGAQLISANGGGGGGNNDNFAPKRTYPQEDGAMNQNEGALAMAPTAPASAYKKHRNTGSGGGVHMPRCQVDGCKEDLGKAKKDYHRRHKVCEMHSKAPKVITSGFEQRFCQQCSRFHAISEFDDAKRSCRRRLAGHNERRRKSSQDTAALSLASMFQEDRRHLNYYMQHPLAMPLSFPIYQNEDTRRSRVIELEEQVAMACRAQCAMNGGTLPSYAANRLLSILHAYKGSSSSSTHDVLEYSNTNNHNNNNNPSLGEGLTLCSNSVSINGASQPSSGQTSMLAASLEAASQQLGLLDSGRALSLLSSGGGQPLRNSTHHQASLDPEILNHHIITSSNQSLNANPTHHAHHHHQDQYQANNHSALIPLSTDNDYHLKDPKLFTDSPRNLALSIGMSPAGGNVDQPMMASNHNDTLGIGINNDTLGIGINNDQRFATSSAHGVATDFSQHFHPLRVYENNLFTAHANMQSHV